MLSFAKFDKFVPYEQGMSWSTEPSCPETHIPSSAYLHVSSNGNFTVRASISISKTKAKFTWNINKLHCKVFKMFNVNNSNYHLINGLWAVSLPKSYVSFKILTNSRMDASFYCPLWRLHLLSQPPQSTSLCTFTKKYFILASLVLPQNLATLRNHLVHPADPVSPAYSASFLQLMSTIFYKTSKYHSVSCKEMENVYFFFMHIWNISLAGSNTMIAWVLFRLPKFMWVVCTPSLHLGSPGLKSSQLQSSSQFFSPPPTSCMTIYVVVISFLNKL